MSSLKDIQALSLPIPQFDKDLNLIRFKAIFKLMQESQNDIVHNTEILEGITLSFDQRVQDLENEDAIQRGELDDILDRAPQSYKTTDDVVFNQGTFQEIVLPNYPTLNANLITLHGRTSALENLTDQPVKTTSNVIFNGITITQAAIIAGVNIMTKFGSVDGEISALQSDKLNKTTHASFIENFDLEGDM